MNNKVKMLKSMPGVHDGDLHPVQFLEGEEYEIGPDLLQAFINCGAVELAEAGDETSAEAKSEGEAPENKALKGAPENKSKKK